MTARLAAAIPLAALMLGAAILAFAPILVRLSDTSPAASAFWRMALGVPLLWVWVWLFERHAPAPAAAAQPSAPQTSAPGASRWPASWSPQTRLLALAGLFFACDLAALHAAIARTSVANATLELNLAPVFVTLGAWLLFRQRVSRWFLAALLLTLVGVALLVTPAGNAGSQTRLGDALLGDALLGDAFGLLAGFFYACYLLTIKSASTSVSTARIMAVNTSIAALLLAPYAWLNAAQLWPQSAEGWLILAALALLVHVLGQSLIALGIARLSASFSSVSLLLQPVLAAVYAWSILGEAMGPVQMAGGVIVLCGIYLAKRAA